VTTWTILVSVAGMYQAGWLRRTRETPTDPPPVTPNSLTHATIKTPCVKAWIVHAKRVAVANSNNAMGLLTRSHVQNRTARVHDAVVDVGMVMQTHNA
jgi:hypothetical protein